MGVLIYGISAGVHGRYGWRGESADSRMLVRWYFISSWLVVSNMNFIFHFIYGMSSFPLTNSYFSRWLLHHQPASYVQVSKVFSAAGWGFPWFPLNPIHLWGISGALNVTEKMEVIFMGSGDGFCQKRVLLSNFDPYPSNLNPIWQFSSRPKKSKFCCYCLYWGISQHRCRKSHGKTMDTISRMIWTGQISVDWSQGKWPSTFTKNMENHHF